jgi:hypothetical protein
VVNGIYTCDTCVSGGAPVSNTPTPTQTPTPTRTPTQTPTPSRSSCYQLLVAISLSPCAICNSTLEYTDVVYCSTPTLSVGSIVYLNSNCTTPITGGKLIQDSIGGTVYQTNPNGSLIIYSCEGLDCGGTGGGTEGNASCYSHVVYLSTDECSLCDSQFNTNILTVYSPSVTLTNGSLVYYQSNCASPIPSNYFLRDVTNGNVFDIGINGVLTIYPCTNCPTTPQCECTAVRNPGNFPYNINYTDCNGNSITLSVPGSSLRCICYDANNTLDLNGPLYTQPCDGGGGLVLNGCCDQNDITCC